MTYRPLTKEALETACRRLDDFYKVHKNDDEFVRAQAMTVLVESLGEVDCLLDLLDYFVDRGGRPEEELAALWGFLMGPISGPSPRGIMNIDTYTVAHVSYCLREARSRARYWTIEEIAYRVGTSPRYMEQIFEGTAHCGSVLFEAISKLLNQKPERVINS